MNADSGGDTGYSVDAGDLSRDGDAAVAVWRASLGHVDGRAAKFDWFYRDAPDGALLQLLRHGPARTVVGTAGVGWRRMRGGGRELRAGLLADMAVMSDHRMLGPAMSLQRAASDRALRDGDLVYGFPNPHAVPVVKRLGYAHAGDMVMYVRVLRHAPYLAQHVPRITAALLGMVLDLGMRMRDGIRQRRRGRLQAQWHDGLPPGDPPQARDDGDEALQANRTRTTLEHRFTHCPLAAFRFLQVSREGDPSASAWFACQRDGEALRIADYAIADHAQLSHYLTAAAAAAYALGCRSLAIECCLPEGEEISLRTIGFRERYRRPIYARWKDPSLSRTRLRFTAFDEDE